MLRCCRATGSSCRGLSGSGRERAAPPPTATIRGSMSAKPAYKHKTVFAQADGRAPEYWECPTCGFISGDPAFLDSSSPCPSCGATGVERRRFPTDRIRRLDERIRAYSKEGDYEIVVILVMALLETILEDILDRIME